MSSEGCAGIGGRVDRPDMVGDSLSAILEKAQAKGQTDVVLSLTEEEKGTIKQLLTSITQIYGNAQVSEQRMKQLQEVTTLRFQIEHLLRHTPMF